MLAAGLQAGPLGGDPDHVALDLGHGRVGQHEFFPVQFGSAHEAHVAVLVAVARPEGQHRPPQNAALDGQAAQFGQQPPGPTGVRVDDLQHGVLHRPMRVRTSEQRRRAAPVPLQQEDTETYAASGRIRGVGHIGVFDRAKTNVEVAAEQLAQRMEAALFPGHSDDFGRAARLGRYPRPQCGLNVHQLVVGKLMAEHWQAARVNSQMDGQALGEGIPVRCGHERVQLFQHRLQGPRQSPQVILGRPRTRRRILPHAEQVRRADCADEPFRSPSGGRGCSRRDLDGGLGRIGLAPPRWPGPGTLRSGPGPGWPVVQRDPAKTGTAGSMAARNSAAVATWPILGKMNVSAYCCSSSVSVPVQSETTITR